MKKVLLTAVPVLAMALSAFAQDGMGLKTSKANTETVGFTVTGGLDFNWVNRDGALTVVRGDLLGDDSPHNEDVIHGDWFLAFDVDLSEKVKIHAKIQNPRFASNVGDAGNANNADVMGSDFLGSGVTGQGIFIKEATVLLNEVLDPSVSILAGANTWAFSIRDNGQSLFWDPSHSAGIRNNIAGPSVGIDNSRNELQPTGVVVMYNRDAMHLNVGLLPSIIERGGSSADEGAVLATLLYDLNMGGMGKGSRIGALLALINPADNGSFVPGGGVGYGMYTFGGGANLVDLGVPHLNLFGEVYINAGTIGQAGGTDQKAKGMAFEVGGHYNIEQEMNPWIEGKFTFLSGDSNTADSNVKSYCSYESEKDLMIIEDPFFGLDWDSNLTAFKVSGGASLNVGQGKNNLDLKAIVGLCKTNKKITIGGQSDSKLGTEVDVTATLHFSKQVTLDAGVAYLIGSEILEDLGGGSAADPAAKKSMLTTIGLNAGF